MKRFMFFFGILTLFSACEKENAPIVMPNANINATTTIEENHHNPYFCNEPSDAQAGQIYMLEGKTWLWGGRGEQQDFNVSNWSLNISQLGSGLGRELIEALVFPTYEGASKQNIRDDEKVIVVKGKHETRLYTYDLLTKHELVNDEIDGEAILIGYCPLADLAVVYNRTYCDTKLFFALSGYTYIEQDEKLSVTSTNSIESFVLWDRNTESLWYPFQNIAVSGEMFNQKMNYFDKNKWELTTYSEALEKYSNNLKVLSYNNLPNFETSLKDLKTDIECN